MQLLFSVNPVRRGSVLLLLSPSLALVLKWQPTSIGKLVANSDAVFLLDAAGPPAGGGAGAAVQLAALPAPGVAAGPLPLHHQRHSHREPHGQVPQPGYFGPVHCKASWQTFLETRHKTCLEIILSIIYLFYGQDDDGSTKVYHTSPCQQTRPAIFLQVNATSPFLTSTFPFHISTFTFHICTNTTSNNLSSLSSPDDYKRPLKTWHLVAALAVYLALLALLLLHILTLLASADTSGTPASADKDNDTVAEVEDQAATHGGCAGWPQYSNARRCAMQLTTHVT